ncbi:MAG: hypothetical protein RLZ98_1164 [Pseudomonadota bacterium]
MTRLPKTGVAAVLACAIALPAAAQTPEEFYKGRRMDLIVGSGAGGGYDEYARLLARHMDRYIPGKPSIVVKNMTGGGGRVAAQHVYTVMAKDGSGFASTLRQVAFERLYHGDPKRVDGTKFSWIGSLNSEVSLCVTWHNKNIKTIDDAKKKDVLIGASGPASSDAILPRVLNRMTGSKLKPVLGYPSSTEVHIAMERGEVDGRCGLGYDSLLARYSQWLTEKKVNILAQFSLKKHPDLPNVPHAMELARNDEDKQIVELLMGPNEMGRPFFGPPEIPADRLAVLRKAFADTTRTPNSWRRQRNRTTRFCC